MSENIIKKDKKNPSKFDLGWLMNYNNTKMRKQGGWWREIVQKSNIRHFPELKNQKKESTFKRVDLVTTAMKEYASLQNFRMPEIMRRS